MSAELTTPGQLLETAVQALATQHGWRERDIITATLVLQLQNHGTGKIRSVVTSPIGSGEMSEQLAALHTAIGDLGEATRFQRPPVS
jgi:hypothetical protein